MRRLFGLVLSALLLIASAQAAVLLEVLIDVREEIAAGRFEPSRDSVGMRGAVAPLSWQSSAAATATAKPGVYSLSLRFESLPANGQPLPYKFKIDTPGRPNDGWEPGRNRSLVLADGVQRLERAFGTDPNAPPPQRTGDIELLPPLASAHVTPREVQVWLPPGYRNEPKRRYPVLYLHDGQNVFDNRAAGAEWQVDETAQRLVLAGAVEPMIIVAVANTGERIDDYTPVAMEFDGRTRGGGAAAYGRYLVSELKPAIDRRYRTKPGRDGTAVGGSSLGGLMSMWLVLEHDNTFGAALVVSPSVWWGRRAILARLAATPAAAPVPRLWLDVGTGEGPDTLTDARRLRDALRARGWAPAYLEAADAGHDELAWAARVEPMLRFLYGRTAAAAKR